MRVKAKQIPTRNLCKLLMRCNISPVLLQFSLHNKPLCPPELYSIGGNAFGKICMFPFLYKDRWYGDCTTFDSKTKRSWCAVETKYEHEQWGYCPSSCECHRNTSIFKLNMLACRWGGGGVSEWFGMDVGTVCSSAQPQSTGAKRW